MGLAGDVHPLHGEGEFVGPRDGLDDDVFFLDTGFGEFGEGALEQGGDDSRVPASVDDADSEGGAWWAEVVSGG